MSKQKYNLTLTRWHKVIERIRDEIKREESHITAGISKLSFDRTSKPISAVDIANKIQSEQQNSIQNLQLYLQAVAKIRTELAKANAKLGINERLNKIESSNKLLTVYEAVLKHENDAGMTASDFDALPAQEKNAYSLREREFVHAHSKEQVQAFKDIVEAGRRAAHKLSDEIADINRSLLSIDLDDRVAAIAAIKD